MSSDGNLTDPRTEGSSPDEQPGMSPLYSLLIVVLIGILAVQIYMIASRLSATNVPGNLPPPGGGPPGGAAGTNTRALLSGPPGVLYSGIAGLSSTDYKLDSDQLSKLTALLQNRKGSQPAFNAFVNVMLTTLSPDQMDKVRKNDRLTESEVKASVKINPSSVPADPIWALALDVVAKAAGINWQELQTAAIPSPVAATPPPGGTPLLDPSVAASGLINLARAGGLSKTQAAKLAPFLKTAMEADIDERRLREQMLDVLTDAQKAALTLNGPPPPPPPSGKVYETPPKPSIASHPLINEPDELLYALTNGRLGRSMPAAPLQIRRPTALGQQRRRGGKRKRGMGGGKGFRREPRSDAASPASQAPDSSSGDEAPDE